MMPEALREWALDDGNDPDGTPGLTDVVTADLLACASAWELDRKRIEAWQMAYDMLAGHVECAKVLRLCQDCKKAHDAALRGEE